MGKRERFNCRNDGPGIGTCKLLCVLRAAFQAKMRLAARQVILLTAFLFCSMLLTAVPVLADELSKETDPAVSEDQAKEIGPAISENQAKEAGLAQAENQAKEAGPAQAEDRAQNADSARADELAKDGMTPVYGFDIADGDYAVAADTSSSFFRMHDATLHVEGGEMSLTFTIASLSYRYVYPGTSGEAEQAGEGNWITRQEKENTSIFTIPVPALNESFDCAAYSVNRDRWYDRKVLVDASSLPENAVRFAVPDYEKIRRALLYYRANGKDAEGGTSEKGGAAEGSGSGTPEEGGAFGESGSGTPEEGGAFGESGSGMSEEGGLTGENGTPEGNSPAEEKGTLEEGGEMEENASAPEPVRLDLPDGEYSIEVNMTGGSGRASISSPTLLTIRDGRAYARLLWSSSYYDYMVQGGEIFYNLTTDGGNSAFEIPITAMDAGIPVIADTTAMGDPVEIVYTLEFYEDSIGDKSAIPQEAAKRVLIAALVMIVLGGILNFLVKRARR